MRKGWAPLALAAAFALGGACAGDSTGVDNAGDLPDEDSTLVEPTFASIQRHVLTPVCAVCHTGSAAPLGLVLDPDVAWSNLVGVTSVQLDPLPLVFPGKPDSSYLVWKIEGRTGMVGARMPLGAARLSSDVILAIRTWIAAGALQQ